MARTAQIDVSKLSPGHYEVIVDEFTSSRSFEVTLAQNFFQEHAGGRSEEEFIRDVFRFLLSREPKESILERFDIADISTYFPEFEKEIGRLM